MTIGGTKTHAVTRNGVELVFDVGGEGPLLSLIHIS